MVVLVDILVVPVDGQSSDGAVSGSGDSVVFHRGPVSVAPTNVHIQSAGLRVCEVVGVIEGGAVTVGLEGRLVTLQLIPVAGVLSIRNGCGVSKGREAYFRIVPTARKSKSWTTGNSRQARSNSMAAAKPNRAMAKNKIVFILNGLSNDAKTGTD